MKQKVKAKITRTVTETVICIIDRDGNVEEVLEIMDEHEYEVTDVHTILTVINDIP